MAHLKVIKRVNVDTPMDSMIHHENIARKFEKKHRFGVCRHTPFYMEMMLLQYANEIKQMTKSEDESAITDQEGQVRFH